MKPSHLTTPRSLADCTFTTGYSSASVSRRERAADVALAAVLGVGIAFLLVAWWSS